jgi:hypothetical protein
MTSISATSFYPSSYAAILAKAQGKIASAASNAFGGSPSSATNVTLSDAAKAALAGKDYATVVADARATLDKLLLDAKLASPLQDGKLAVDLSKVDRRELYAMSVNAEQKFSVDEQKAAQIEMQNRFDQAMAGPTAVARVTGSLKGLYVAALALLDSFGAEEKASSSYADQRAALENVLKQLTDNPGTMPTEVPSDPISAYMDRLAAGETGEPRDFGDVTSDARATLDAQYADGADDPDYADFDSRSLAAVALNAEGKFSPQEVRAAKTEMGSRTAQALLAGLKSTSTTDPAGFASNVISLYGAMSAEERAAAGWSDNLYQAAVASYQTSSKLAQMLGSTTTSSPWASKDDNASKSGSMSLVDYL